MTSSRMSACSSPRSARPQGLRSPSCTIDLRRKTPSRNRRCEHGGDYKTFGMRGPSSLWFIGIVANQCKEVRRGKWWHLVRLPDVSTMQPIDEGAWSEGEDLRRAVMRLPYDQRVAVLMHFHLDMPLSEVAIALGLSVGGVKTRIKRALKRLRPAIAVSEVRANG